MRHAFEGRVCLGDDSEGSGAVCAECGCSICLLPAAEGDDRRGHEAHRARPCLPAPLRTRYPFPHS